MTLHPNENELLKAAKRVYADYDLHIRGQRAPDYTAHWQALLQAIKKAEETK